MLRAIFVLSMLILAGCAAPTPTLVPKQLPPTEPPPMATFTTIPTRVVTLAKATLVPATPTPTIAVTLPDGAVLVTLGGEQSVNLRAGPGTLYPIVLRVTSGTSWPAVARSEMGEWLLLASPEIPGGQAWVYVGITNYSPDAFPLPAATAVSLTLTPQP